MVSRLSEPRQQTAHRWRQPGIILITQTQAALCPAILQRDDGKPVALLVAFGNDAGQDRPAGAVSHHLAKPFKMAHPDPDV